MGRKRLALWGSTCGTDLQRVKNAEQRGCQEVGDEDEAGEHTDAKRKRGEGGVGEQTHCQVHAQGHHNTEIGSAELSEINERQRQVG